MIKKIFVLGIFLAGVLVISSLPVSALDEELTFEDPEGDVFKFDLTGEGENTSSRPNVDITNIEYYNDGKEVTLNLKVKGKIENRGDINDEESLDLVIYNVILYTSDDNTYEILYVNKECQLNDEDHGFDWDVKENSILSVTFDLQTSKEILYAIEATTLDSDGLFIYGDEFYYESDSPIIDAGGPYEAEPGEYISFTSDAVGGVAPYTYTWDFGDGTTSELQDPVHSYSEAGSYIVTLTIEDDDGTVVMDTAIVTINGPSGSNDDNGGSNLLLFLGLIAIVIVVGIVVVIIVIKR